MREFKSLFSGGGSGYSSKTGFTGSEGAACRSWTETERQILGEVVAAFSGVAATPGEEAVKVASTVDASTVNESTEENRAGDLGVVLLGW